MSESLASQLRGLAALILHGGGTNTAGDREETADLLHRAAAALEFSAPPTGQAQAGERVEVPKEPTEAMLEAGGSAIWEHASKDKEALVRSAYKAMLSASPVEQK